MLNSEMAVKIAKKPMTGKPARTAEDAPLPKIITGIVNGNNINGARWLPCLAAKPKTAASAAIKINGGVPKNNAAAKMSVSWLLRE